MKAVLLRIPSQNKRAGSASQGQNNSDDVEI
jgi:hypothetical protein